MLSAAAFQVLFHCYLYYYRFDMDSEEQEDLLQEILPEGYVYKFDLEQNNLQEIKFCLETRVNIDSQTNVKQFL